MSLYVATNVDGVFTVVVDSLNRENVLHFSPERMTAWQQCIIEFAIQGRLQDAFEENVVSGDSDLHVEYTLERQLGWGDDAQLHDRICVGVRF